MLIWYNENVLYINYHPFPDYQCIMRTHLNPYRWGEISHRVTLLKRKPTSTSQQFLLDQCPVSPIIEISHCAHFCVHTKYNNYWYRVTEEKMEIMFSLQSGLKKDYLIYELYITLHYDFACKSPVEALLFSRRVHLWHSINIKLL